MKELFIVFFNNGIIYNYNKHFNANREFHGVCLSMWDKQRKQEPSFGTFSNRAEMDEDADRKLRQAQQQQNINPFQDVMNKETYTALVRLIVWIFGRYLCTRGRKEIAKVDWCEMFFGKYQTGPDK